MPPPVVCKIKGDKVSPLLRKQVKDLTIFAQNTADALESVQAERDALKAKVLKFKSRFHTYRYRYRECKAKLPRTGDTTVSILSNGEMEQDLSGFDIPKPTDDDGMVLKTDQPADDDEMMVAGGEGVRADTQDQDKAPFGVLFPPFPEGEACLKTDQAEGEDYLKPDQSCPDDESTEEE
jgi:hypothetical protein